MKNLFDTPQALANLSEALPMMLEELADLSANGDATRAESVKATIVALFGAVIDAATAEMEKSDH